VRDGGGKEGAGRSREGREVGRGRGVREKIEGRRQREERGWG